MRTPLAVIRGATELLLSRPDLDEKIRQRLLRIQRAEMQCTDLIGSLLLLSRNERGQGNTPVSYTHLDVYKRQAAGNGVGDSLASQWRSRDFQPDLHRYGDRRYRALSFIALIQQLIGQSS